MIESYNEVLAHKLAEFSQVGFKLVHDTTYCARLTNGLLTIKFNTERYYQPSLSTSFQHSGDPEKTFRIILREILAPEQANFDNDVLRKIALENHFDSADLALIKENGSLA